MDRPQNNFNNHQNRPDERKCYKYNRSGHLARDCRQRPEQNQESRECYVCEKRGHLARDCYQPITVNHKTINIIKIIDSIKITKDKDAITRALTEETIAKGEDITSTSI